MFQLKFILDLILECPGKANEKEIAFLFRIILGYCALRKQNVFFFTKYHRRIIDTMQDILNFYNVKYFSFKAHLGFPTTNLVQLCKNQRINARHSQNTNKLVIVVFQVIRNPANGFGGIFYVNIVKQAGIYWHFHKTGSRIMQKDRRNDCQRLVIPEKNLLQTDT